MSRTTFVVDVVLPLAILGVFFLAMIGLGALIGLPVSTSVMVILACTGGVALLAGVGVGLAVSAYRRRTDGPT